MWDAWQRPAEPQVSWGGVDSGVDVDGGAGFEVVVTRRSVTSRAAREASPIVEYARRIGRLVLRDEAGMRRT